VSEYLPEEIQEIKDIFPSLTDKQVAELIDNIDTLVCPAVDEMMLYHQQPGT
jgi:hypothetical protein